jgi:uncharacterized membrane protein YjgN (DUF898 family)
LAAEIPRRRYKIRSAPPTPQANERRRATAAVITTSGANVATHNCCLYACDAASGGAISKSGHSAGIALYFFSIFVSPALFPACGERARDGVEASLKGDQTMTVIDQVDSAATLPPPPGPVRLRFIGRVGDYWRLMIRGAVFQAITLGIYRFWLFTDMRRFLWAATRVAGETPEYTGTASELLIGFLVAIGILIPIYGLFFIGSLELGLLSQLSPVIAFIVLAGFGEYAAYRARRYRLTRTVFRGLRFHQTGSAARYAVRALLWWFPVVLTFGLAWPFAMANLERYKMRNTFYGDLGGSFAGSGARLFRSGFLIWLLVLAPLVAGLVAAGMAIDWSVVDEALELDAFDAFYALQDDDGIKIGLGLLVSGVSGSMMFGAFLYPAYQAIVMRWWLGGVRLGGAACASDLSIGRYYQAYVMYLAYVMLFSIAFLIAVGLVCVFGYLGLHDHIDFVKPSPLVQGSLAAAGIAAYVVYILGTYTIYQVVVKMSLWQAAVESMVISGYAAFDRVRASEAVSSALGEGLADALGGGGI